MGFCWVSGDVGALLRRVVGYLVGTDMACVLVDALSNSELSRVENSLAVNGKIEEKFVQQPDMC